MHPGLQKTSSNFQSGSRPVISKQVFINKIKKKMMKRDEKKIFNRLLTRKIFCILRDFDLYKELILYSLIIQV